MGIDVVPQKAKLHIALHQTVIWRMQYMDLGAHLVISGEDTQ